jgi:hypothetical protein
LPTDKTANTRTTVSETTATVTQNQGGATAVSAITEGILPSALAEAEHKRKTESTDFNHHLSALESYIAYITEKIASMSTSMTDEVMRRLSAPDGPLANQDRVLAEQNNKMERMFQMLLALTANVENVTTEVAKVTVLAPSTSLALPRSPQGRDSPTNVSTTADTCPSPDRQRQTLDQPDDGHVVQME